MSSGLRNETRRLAKRIGAGLAAPTSIMLVIPLLVMGAGVLVWINGATHLRAGVHDMVRGRFEDQARRTQDEVTNCLDQADTLLTVLERELARHPTPPSPDALAPFLRGLIDGRPGISHIGFATDAGLYIAVYCDSTGRLMLTHRYLDADGASEQHDYRFGPDGELVRFLTHHDTGFHVTERPFYRAASDSETPVWTSPYIFYDSGLAGISRVRRFAFADGAPAGVLSIDFSVGTLSPFVDRLRHAESTRVFLFTADGVLLAHPDITPDLQHAQRGEGTLMRIDGIDDPSVRALHRAWQDGRIPADGAVGIFTHQGRNYVGHVSPCPGSDELCWRIGQIAPLQLFTGALRDHARDGMIRGAAVLVLALVVAAIFAGHIVRVHRRAAQDRQRAVVAEHRARALGAYELVELLGSGGTGEVWRARHRLLAFPAAIKLIRPDSIGARRDGGQLLRRFIHEARAIASLHSPYTIRLFDFGRSHDGRLYYVMELLDGVDLECLVSDYGRQPAARVIPILRQICGSLEEAHAQGIIHRDVKPANIYLCRRGCELDQVKVLDFGLVRPIDLPEDQRLTTEGYIEGTPGYMSPEQIADETLTAQSDVYAFGCVAFWLLTGRSVFPRAKTMDVLLAHLHDTPPDSSDLAGQQPPPDLVDLIAACLAKSPTRRPAGMVAVRSALDAITDYGHEPWSIGLRAAWWAHIPSLHDRVRTESAQHGGLAEAVLIPEEADDDQLPQSDGAAQPVGG
ncbi:MAG: serine/threonine protein kinase [Planctomycetota bacterium]